MKNFTRKFARNLGRIFYWRYLPWHLLAIGLTYVIVATGFDWWYFKLTNPLSPWFWIPAGLGGGLLPLLVPMTLFIIARAQKSTKVLQAAQALTQAVILGSFTSSLYKFFTGRIPPVLEGAVTDISHGFQFGLGKGGIFWGWPSSHTTIAFAMAVTLIILYPENKKLKIGMLLYAIYIGFGASIGFHWFSEFAAGIIFGVLVGWIVGKSFKTNQI